MSGIQIRNFRVVTYMRMHGTSHVMGYGELPATLPNPSKVIPGLHMVEGLSGVEVSVAGILNVVPYANIQCYSVVKETTPVPVIASPTAAKGAKS